MEHEEPRSLTPLNGPRCATGAWVTPDREQLLASQERRPFLAKSQRPLQRKRQFDDCCGLGPEGEDCPCPCRPKSCDANSPTPSPRSVANIAVAIKGHTGAGHTAYTISVAITGHTDVCHTRLEPQTSRQGPGQVCYSRA